ncbi:MAG: Uma2 family endonuclease [Planctomycetes bacterium]|nr:Uma2 family endonuclease [Planctomycetota bacterium]
MSTVLDAPVMTTAELLAMPRNGVDRWLIEGQLREKPMTIRNRVHSRIMVRSSKFLDNWNDTRPLPRGLVLCGEAGCRLLRNPDTTVGIDVVYIAANLVQQESEETTLIDGIPTLIIEILSPSDIFEEIKEKIDLYQKVGVPLIWVIDPHDRTVTIYRQGAEPELVNVNQELTGDPHLPGFRVKVAEIFA